MKSRRVDLRFLDDTEEEGDKEGWQQGQSSAVGRQGEGTITLGIRHEGQLRTDGIVETVEVGHIDRTGQSVQGSIQIRIRTVVPHRVVCRLTVVVVP